MRIRRVRIRIRIREYIREHTRLTRRSLGLQLPLPTAMSVPRLHIDTRKLAQAPMRHGHLYLETYTGRSMTAQASADQLLTGRPPPHPASSAHGQLLAARAGLTSRP